jgi:biopolymer transport protein TolR
MAMKTGGTEDLNSEINVTPMVDVMLVLLIIFMVTAPLMNTGVDIELPQVTAKQIDDPEGKLIMSIDRNNVIRLGEGANASQIAWVELEAKLKTNARVKADKALYIDADKSVPYGVVVTAMAVAQQAGVDKVMMLTDPAETLKLSELDQNSKH